jgi:integrase
VTEQTVVPCRIADAAGEWLAVRAADHMPENTEVVRRVLAEFAGAAPASVCRAIPHHVSGWMQRLRDRGLSASTVNARRTYLASFFSWCVGRSYCLTNPVAAVKPLPVVHNHATVPVRTAGDFWRLYRAMPDDVSAATVGLLATTGLRTSEAANLEWPHWRQDDGLLEVVAQGAEAIQGVRTTKHHRRLLPVGTHLRRFLSILALVNRVGGPYITGSHGGRKRNGMRTYRLLKRQGCTRHDLRRFFQTGLETVRAPSYIIDDLLCHTTSYVRNAYTAGDSVEAARPVIADFDAWLADGM